MKIIVGCEFSATVRDAFRRRGHEAWSCDLLPCEGDPDFHIVGDVLKILNNGWDLGIFHPPCTYLTVSVNGPITHGCSLYTAEEGQRRRELAAAFFMALINAPIHRIAVENPIGIMSTRYRTADQVIQPHEFGHDASKGTCLWLKNLPPLMPTHVADDWFAAQPPPPRIVNGLPRYANQTDSGQNKLPPSEDRWALRSITYPGIATAMAEQWGRL